jgi:hypothetical protein
MTDQRTKELFFEADTRLHQQLVATEMIICIKHLLDRAMRHDETKFSKIERESYIDPVWKLASTEYGSDEYKRIVKQMGEGWKHHKQHNDHHPKLLSDMNLFSLLEMLCDWVSASMRKGNDPLLPWNQLEKEQGLEKDSLIYKISANTVRVMQELREQNDKHNPEV